MDVLCRMCARGARRYVRRHAGVRTRHIVPKAGGPAAQRRGGTAEDRRGSPAIYSMLGTSCVGFNGGCARGMGGGCAMN